MRFRKEPGGGHLNTPLESPGSTIPQRSPQPTSRGQSCREHGLPLGPKSGFLSHTKLLNPTNSQVTSFQKVTEGSLTQTINPLRVSSLRGRDLRQCVTDDKNHKPNLWGAGWEAGEEDKKPAGSRTWHMAVAQQNQPTDGPKTHPDPSKAGLQFCSP